MLAVLKFVPFYFQQKNLIENKDKIDIREKEYYNKNKDNIMVREREYSKTIDPLCLRCNISKGART